MFLYLFILGLGGSLHCVGMCGSLSLIAPMNRNSMLSMAKEMAMYHSGRILTYIILGAIIGSVGHLFEFNQIQSYLSIAFGTLLLLYGLNKFFGTSLFKASYVQNKMVVSLYNKVLTSKLKSTSFLLGLLNGIVPCGLVYSAMALSFMNADLVMGGINMMAFGIGTLPLLLLFTFGMNNPTFKSYFKSPYVSATLFSLSGLFIMYKSISLVLPQETTLWSAVMNPIMCH